MAFKIGRISEVIQGLSLPIDIPWRRLCASADMMDKIVCDRKFPYRWRSSLSVFYYEPPVDQQAIEGMKVSYLKVSCTITGYQADGKEIGLDKRRLDQSWNTSDPIKLLGDAVDTYYPCYGALLEVAIAPQLIPDRPEDVEKLFPDDYPYFADFQPKKRELYEMVTDTGEKMSRTLEELNVKKGMTTSQSHEVYDETTFGVKGTVGASSGPISASGTVSYENKSGTKDISQQEQSNVNASDNSREMRENFSHTTNFTQMYSEFNSYHLGTNRGVFFMLPRPHIVQAEENTFVQGPRQLEGIQEVFLVVMRPSKIPFIRVEGYLETAHIYNKKEMAPPTPHDVSYHLDPDVKEGTRVLSKVPFNVHWDSFIMGIKYKSGDIIDATPYQNDFTFWAPDGSYIALDYTVDGTNYGYEIVVPAHGKGFDFKLVQPDPSFLKFQATILQLPKQTIPQDLIKYNEGRPFDESKASVDPVMDVQLIVYTRSKEAKPITTGKTMYLTGRGVCCGTISLTEVKMAHPQSSSTVESVTFEKVLPTSSISLARSNPPNKINKPDQGMTIKEANLIRNDIGRIMVNSVNSDKRYQFGSVGLLDTQFVSDAIANTIKDREHSDNIPVKQHPQQSSILDNINKISPRINKAQLLQMTIQEQMTKYGLDYNEVTQLRRTLLGLEDKKPVEKTVEVEVPNVIGMALDKASNIIRKTQLSVGESTYQDDVKPKGTVIKQDPEARTKVQVNSDIYLVLSSGISLQIPDVVGKKLEYALTILHENGLKSEPVIVFFPSEKHPRNTVLKVTPKVGAAVVPGTEITLEVSSGRDKHEPSSHQK